MVTNNINDVLNEVNEPTLDEIINFYSHLRKYSSYGYSCHKTGYSDETEHENLCKKIYKTWYHTATTLETTDEGWMNVKRILLNNPKYNPANIKDGEFTQTLYGLENNKDLEKYMPAWNQSDEFLHVFCGKFIGGDTQKAEGRLYLNLKKENIVSFVNKFIGEVKKSNLATYFKFASNDNRPDTFIIYTDFKKIPNYIEIIEKIKAEAPELLKGTELVSPNFATFKNYPYIGFGTEPNNKLHLQRYQKDLEEAKRTGTASPDEDDYKYSYNSLRKNAVNEILEKINEKNKKLFKIDLDKQYFMGKNMLTFRDCISQIAKKYYSEELKNLDEEGRKKVVDRITQTTLNTIFTNRNYLKESSYAEKISVRDKSKNLKEISFDTTLILKKLANGRKLQTIHGNLAYNYCQMKEFVCCEEGKSSKNVGDLINLAFTTTCQELYDDAKNPENSTDFRNRCNALLNLLTKESKDHTNTTIKSAVYSYIYSLNTSSSTIPQTLLFKDFGIQVNIDKAIAEHFYPEKNQQIKEEVCQKYDLSPNHFCANQSNFAKSKNTSTDDSSSK